MPILIFGAGSVVALWTAAVHVLSKAGVARALCRGVFILLLLPGVLVAILGTVGLVIFLFMILITYLYLHGEGPPPGTMVTTELIGLAILPVWCWGLRSLSQWVFRADLPDAAAALRGEGSTTETDERRVDAVSQEEIP